MNSELCSVSGELPALNQLFDSLAYVKVGPRVVDLFLEIALRKAVSQIGEADRLDHLVMFREDEAGLIHGGFTLGGSLGSFFFYEEVSTGLTRVIHPGTGGSRIARFVSN